jgi:hypothetical protein
MTTPGDLIERLDAIVARAIAVTKGDPAAARVDESALLAELSATTEESMERTGEMVPVLERLEGVLRAALAELPYDSEQAAFRYDVSMLKWQPIPPVMPRLATAFVACDRLHIALERRRYQLAKARYDALRAPGDRCDCAAKGRRNVLRARAYGSTHAARLKRGPVRCDELPLAMPSMRNEVARGREPRRRTRPGSRPRPKRQRRSSPLRAGDRVRRAQLQHRCDARWFRR